MVSCDEEMWIPLTGKKESFILIFFVFLNTIEPLYSDILYRNNLYLVIKGFNPILGQLYMNKLHIT